MSSRSAGRRRTAHRALHRLGEVGTCWRQRHGSLLAELTIPRESRIERLPQLRDQAGVQELVYIATCGRVEVAFVTDSSVSFDACRRNVFEALTGREPRAGEAEHAMRAWHGEGAAEHLFVVASGLDSARVGESEIAGQIRWTSASPDAAGGRYGWSWAPATRVHGGTARGQAREADDRRADRRRVAGGHRRAPRRGARTAHEAAWSRSSACRR